MISQIREQLSKLAHPIIIFFAKMRIHPTIFTIIGLLLAVATGVFLGLNNFLAAFILIWLAGTMDFLDGGVARYRNLETKQGSFLDSVVDRLSDIAVFAGIIWSEPVDAVTGIIMIASGQSSRRDSSPSLTSYCHISKSRHMAKYMMISRLCFMPCIRIRLRNELILIRNTGLIFQMQLCRAWEMMTGQRKRLWKEGFS